MVLLFILFKLEPFRVKLTMLLVEISKFSHPIFRMQPLKPRILFSQNLSYLIFYSDWFDILFCRFELVFYFQFLFVNDLADFSSSYFLRDFLQPEDQFSLLLFHSLHELFFVFCRLAHFQVIVELFHVFPSDFLIILLVQVVQCCFDWWVRQLLVSFSAYFIYFGLLVSFDLFHNLAAFPVSLFSESSDCLFALFHCFIGCLNDSLELGLDSCFELLYLIRVFFHFFLQLPHGFFGLFVNFFRQFTQVNVDRISLEEQRSEVGPFLHDLLFVMSMHLLTAVIGTVLANKCADVTAGMRAYFVRGLST